MSGVDVDIITWGGPNLVPEGVRQVGVQVIVMPGLRYFEGFFASIFYLIQLLKNHYDHVFVHFAGYGEGLALKVVRWFKKQPFSAVFHFPPSLVPNRYVEFQRWHIDRDADHLIGVSNSTAREVAEWSGRNVDVIEHGVDSDFFKPDPELRKKTRQQLGIPEDSPVLVTAAALEERKGIQWVIRAIETIPSVYYLVVGDGLHLEKLKQLQKSLNLENRVIFLGFQLEVKKFFAASDIALLLSYGEASPVSLLEYAAMELPVFTSRYEPFPEIIQETWGCMVDEKNTAAVSQKIEELLHNLLLRKQMGKAARSWVMEQHNWDEIASKYKGLVK